MARFIRWTLDKYRLALLGTEGIPGVRRIIEGFMPSDGYDLRNIASWTSSQKARLRNYYHKIRLLEAQEKVIVFPRSKKKLRVLQNAFHGDVPSRKFKAAFVPYTRPVVPPGAKPVAPKITYTKAGIGIGNKKFTRYFASFNKQALALDPYAEIVRVFQTFPKGIEVFYIQTGEFSTLNGKYAAAIANDVLKLMQQYDGKQPLPHGSGNVGDSPKAHHWKYWLNGVYAIKLHGDLTKNQARVLIDQGRNKVLARNKAHDSKIKSLRKKR